MYSTENMQIKVCARKLEVIVLRRTKHYQSTSPEIAEGRLTYLGASVVAREMYDVTAHRLVAWQLLSRGFSGACYSQ